MSNFRWPKLKQANESVEPAPVAPVAPQAPEAEHGPAAEPEPVAPDEPVVAVAVEPLPTAPVEPLPTAPDEPVPAPGPPAWIPADLPSAAPAIGRVGGIQLGQALAGISLRPPAIALDGTVAGPFHVAAASMIGAGHLQSGQPRQDAYNFMAGESGRLYVAIADGMGSKPMSQLGAHLFCESVLVAAAHAEAHGDGTRPGPAELLAQASERMTRLVAEAYGLDPKSAGCVGAVAVFSPAGCSIARIGDVSAFTIRSGAFAEVFAAEDALVNIVAANMPFENADDVEVVDLDPAAVVVLGTDGLANDLRNSGTLREWLTAQWRVPHLPFGVGDTLRYRRQGSHDDRTAVLVWRDDVEDDPGLVPHDPQ